MTSQYESKRSGVDTLLAPSLVDKLDEYVRFAKRQLDATVLTDGKKVEKSALFDYVVIVSPIVEEHSDLSFSFADTNATFASQLFAFLEQQVREKFAVVGATVVFQHPECRGDDVPTIRMFVRFREWSSGWNDLVVSVTESKPAWSIASEQNSNRV